MQYSFFLEDAGLKCHVCNILSNVFSAKKKKHKKRYRKSNEANVAKWDPLSSLARRGGRLLGQSSNSYSMFEIFQYQMLGGKQKSSETNKSLSKDKCLKI